MKFARRQLLHLTAGAAGLAIISVFFFAVSHPGAWSQTTGTIKIVVPFPAGGAVDTLARLLAEEVGRAGPTMVIENRPGAGSVIGTEAVARAAADGSTLLMLANSFVINPHLRKLNYDPLTSFEPICYLVRSPTVLVVNSASPPGRGGSCQAGCIDAGECRAGNVFSHGDRGTQARGQR